MFMYFPSGEYVVCMSLFFSFRGRCQAFSLTTTRIVVRLQSFDSTSTTVEEWYDCILSGFRPYPDAVHVDRTFIRKEQVTLFES